MLAHEPPYVQINCPIACNSLKQCYTATERSLHPHFAWNSIRRVEAAGSNGTICLGSATEAAQVVDECRAWRAASGWAEGAELWLREMSERVGKRVNLTDCDELERSIDPGCAFNQEEVDEFTKEVLQNGGDYTIAFWIKPVSEESLDVDGRFFPHVQLVSTFSPPHHSLGWGHYGDGINGAARVSTACPRHGVEVEAVEIQAVASEGWTFLSFGRVNSTWNMSQGSLGETTTNLKRWRETAGDFTQCLFDDSSFFRGIEVNYPALVSPIMLVSETLPLAVIQELYYDRLGGMKTRDGPLLADQERAAGAIPVTKKDYESKSALMTAPIIFTTRSKANSTCPYEYSTRWVQAQHESVRERQCAPPFVCEARVMSDPAATMACSGDAQDSDTFFGLNPVDFRGVGFADLLFSITDTPFLSREGELRSTQDFIDSQTQSVVVILVFFTPEYGITTVMEVNVDLSGPSDVEVSVKIRHYSMVEGAQLTNYVVAQVLVLACILAMLFDLLLELASLWKHHHDPEYDSNVRLELAKHLTDAVTVVSVTTFVSLRLPVVVATAGETDRILGQLSSIPWASPEVPISSKKGVFFRSIDDLLGRISEQEQLDTFLNAILIISLVRIIQCTGLHPRLALMTGTVRKAMDDFWHAALLIVLMMASFALIGTWRFGDEMEQFQSFERSMQTEFELMFGEFIQEWHNDPELQAFVVFYFMVMYMLVLNFLLAIIVEAYMDVRRDVQSLEVEQEFLTDLVDTFRAIITARVRGWPSTKDLGTILGGAKAKLSVGFTELRQLGVFEDNKKIGSFLQFYGRYDFLEPPEISRDGRVGKRDREESSEERVVRLMCTALDVKPPTLRDIAAGRSRRWNRGDSQGGSPVATRLNHDQASLPPLSTIAEQLQLRSGGVHGGKDQNGRRDAEPSADEIEEVKNHRAQQEAVERSPAAADPDEPTPPSFVEAPKPDGSNEEQPAGKRCMAVSLSAQRMLAEEPKASTTKAAPVGGGQAESSGRERLRPATLGESDDDSSDLHLKVFNV